ELEPLVKHCPVVRLGAPAGSAEVESGPFQVQAVLVPCSSVFSAVEAFAAVVLAAVVLAAVVFLAGAFAAGFLVAGAFLAVALVAVVFLAGALAAGAFFSSVFSASVSATSPSGRNDCRQVASISSNWSRSLPTCS